MAEDTGTEPEAMPEGQLCDRYLPYEHHETFSSSRGPRGGKCMREAKSKDKEGVWACGVHLGADKRGEQNRERAAYNHRVGLLLRASKTKTDKRTPSQEGRPDGH